MSRDGRSLQNSMKCRWAGNRFLEKSPFRRNRSRRFCGHSSNSVGRNCLVSLKNVGVTGTLRIEKKNEGDERTKRTDTIDTEIIIDGQTFVIRTIRMSGTEDAHAITASLSRQSVSTITLNLAHPIFDGLPDVVRRAMAKREISLCVAQRLLPEIAPPRDLLRLAATMSARLTNKPK